MKDKLFIFTANFVIPIAALSQHQAVKHGKRMLGIASKHAEMYPADIRVSSFEPIHPSQIRFEWAKERPWRYDALGSARENMTCLDYVEEAIRERDKDQLKLFE